MIPKETIDKIIDAARVEEVVGDFITLKKRGANYLGLCPFHGEKTPSFTVSPAKGIYKCFGCGKAGTSVNFIMDSQQLSYPEALKWLAKKYNIEVVEREISPEEKALQNEKESLYIVMQYAQRYFTHNLHNSDEGKSVGLSYFIERGFRHDIIEKFQLGYSFEERRALSHDAVKNGYKAEYLVKTGLSILSNQHVEGNPITEQDIFDRYTSRVMFPIHDVGGRVIGFGGRILGSDKKLAKYINSPQTDIYDKSKVLYGLWFAKKAIQEKDNCYLVEGYTDVISMHQSGIENVVASSGTSLTVEQIKAIHRFTNNITVLYDGDSAGEKASVRAIDLLLEEGMNVKVLMFPDNDDPDSFSKKVTADEFKTYIENNTQDFLAYKTRSLFNETKNDPIKKATVIKDIVQSISLIPDAIIRSVYIKECASIMELQENVLQMEVTKLRRNKASKGENKPVQPEVNEALTEALTGTEEKQENLIVAESEEKELLRLILNYGNVIIEIEAENEDKEHHDFELSVSEYVLFELMRDGIDFLNPIHQMVLDEYMHQLQENKLPDFNYFKNHLNPAISTFAIDLASATEELSEKWNAFGVLVEREIYHLKKATQHTIYSLKEKRLSKMIHDMQEELKTAPGETHEEILKDILRLTQIKMQVNKLLGRIVVK
ncbi:MAG: DNA primase [Bacteroidia bacterium]|nr:DNA primase [Bacteroidia bacterium]